MQCENIEKEKTTNTKDKGYVRYMPKHRHRLLEKTCWQASQTRPRTYKGTALLHAVLGVHCLK